MKRTVILYLALWCAVHLLGCSKTEESSSCRSASEVVFVRADGWELTASGLSNTVLMAARMAELAKRPVREDRFPFWANQFAMGSAVGLLQSHLMEEELVRRGTSRTPESDAVVLDRYNKSMRSRFKNEREMATQFGLQEPVFRAQFGRDSLFESFYASSRECAVSEREIARNYQQLSNRLARTERINKKARENAVAALRRLRAGEAWEIVASNMTEDALIEETYADNWKDWGSFKLGDIDCEALVAVLPMMKEGGYTEPIETDEGLVIVRLNEKLDGLYCLSRMLFRMGVEVDLPDRERMIAKLKREKREALQRKLLPELRKKAKIEFPMGTNFTYKIWNEPKSADHKKGALGSLLNKTRR